MTSTLLERSPLRAPVRTKSLRCVTCNRSFDFGAGETGTVVRHIAYGSDFAHPGACLAAALEWIFVEPGYDRPAFSLDRERVSVLRTTPADGWVAVLPDTPEQRLAGSLVRYEALDCWALVEHGDGSRRVEGIIRDPEWEDEPGWAEFAEARPAGRSSLDYVLESERLDPARQARWARLIQARYQAAHPELRRAAWLR